MATHESVGSVCPACGSNQIVQVPYTDHFEYRVGESSVELVASYPVESCLQCHFVTSGEEAEHAQDLAIRKYLGVLSPEEIRNIRESYGLSRQAFAEITGIGIASLGRWEAGELVQNKSSDTLLRFLSRRDNFEALRNGEFSPSKGQGRPLPKLRALKDAALENAVKQKASFRLNLTRTQMTLCT